MHDLTPAKPEAMPNRLLGWVLIFIVCSTLLAIYTGNAIMDMVSIVLVMALPLIAPKSMHLREFYLLGFCVLLAGIALYLGRDLWAMAHDGLSRSAFLVAFLVLMALLREGANTSNSILQVGKYLTHQPPSRRFFSIFAGSHFFSVLINLGSLSLLAPIIQRGVRADYPDGAEIDEIGKVREQRQLSAALRGFSWFLVWAPTAVTQAVMPTLMGGINAFMLIGLGLALASLMMFVSWMVDWLRWRPFSARLRAAHRAPTLIHTPFPARAFRNVGLVSFALFSLSIFFSKTGQVTLISGVMLTAPIVVAMWLLTQNRQAEPSMMNATAARVSDITMNAMPSYIRELVFVACAGFIGTVAARLLPVEYLANILDVANTPSWLILWAITIGVWMFGQVGFSPITSAVFFGSVIAEISTLPVNITLAALAIAAGTAVCSTGAPFAAGILLLSRAAGVSPFTLSWRWNGAYTLTAIAVLAPVYILLTYLIR